MEIRVLLLLGLTGSPEIRLFSMDAASLGSTITGFGRIFSSTFFTDALFVFRILETTGATFALAVFSTKLNKLSICVSIKRFTTMISLRATWGAL